MKKSVIIIGGGIAGLGAANELVRCGIDIVLLEAKRRFGGRIHTLKQGSIPIELGAEFIHGRSPALLQIIKAAELSTHRMPATQQLFEDGRLKRFNFWNKIEEVVDRINPRKPDCSFDDLLMRQDLEERTKRLVRGYAEGFNAARVERISAHAILKAKNSAEQMEGEWQGRINEGYSALIDFLEREITTKGGRLIKGAKVKRIGWKAGKVEVSWQRNKSLQTVVATAAIVTLPLGVLKAGTVSIYPALPKKQTAIGELEFGNVAKVILVFRRRWWPKSGNGIIQSFGEPLPTWWSDRRGPILTGWAGGSKAAKLLSLPPTRLKTLCLEILSRMFSERVSSLLPKMLAAPIANTLFFAGEATVADAQTGTVFGAYESGLRAAREVGDVFFK